MTKIEWTNETWNPVIGCSKISAGCQNCSAERMACRLARRDNKTSWAYDSVLLWNASSGQLRGGWNGNTAFVESQLKKPIRWKKHRNTSVCSMGDLFHESVPVEWIDKVVSVVGNPRCKQHTFQFLTKRAESMAKYFCGLRDDPKQAHRLATSGCSMDHKHGIAMKYRREEHLTNLWLGVTAENQEMADKRIPTLLDIPAAVRFVSLEPLLGPIDFKKIYGPDMMCCVQCGYVGDEPYERDYVTPDDPEEGWPICPKCGETNCGGYNSFDKIGVTPFEMRPFPKIDWVIVGCESGQNRRECKLEWVKRIVEQCTEEDVPVFVKQLPINGKVSKNMAEWPERLRRRETPRKAGE